MKNFNKKTIMYILLVILCFAMPWMVLSENTARVIYMLYFLSFSVWIVLKGMKISWIAEAVISLAPLFLSKGIKLLADSVFAEKAAGFYNFAVSWFFGVVGVKSNIVIGYETSIIFTVCIIFIVLLLIYDRHDRTAMKILKGSDEEEFKQKSYAEKSEMFCKTLRQRMESINRETDWNEDLFTPIEAEVEVNIKGKRKKKFEDLLNCLKSVKHSGSIFLVLGDPGAGKSVSLRKLCLELLDESKKTKKIPVYVNLKKWNEDWSMERLPEKRDLIAFLKNILYENGDILTDTFLNTYFDKMLEDGRWYFVFDSFDEMPCLMGKKNCQELIDKISELLCQFMTGPNQSGGVIASRLYKSPSDAIGATVILKIQEFNDIKIKTMLQKYLVHTGEVIKKLFGQREDLVVLCRNPFYLSLLINYLLDHELSFPENQMELYQNFVTGRLGKCAGKLESERISMEEVHNAAKELASFMQESTVYGLECPTKALFQGRQGQYWRKALRLLEYAKICRLGGDAETVSFVHRRFQEFFLVESIMEQGKAIEYEEYRSIVNHAGMRDALVLYCEVAEDEKAKEIAGFCWKVIQENIRYRGNILEKGSLELVNALYFIAEAFRNRKNVIEGFKEELEQLIKDNLNHDTDFVILLAFTNSMVLFEQTHLQKMILKVFQLRNRWLNDVVMQNCRIIKQLDYHVEMQFVRYFFQLDIRIFIERFRNMRFSLSLSKSFRYIRLIHFLIFLMYMSCGLFMMAVGISVLIYFAQYFVYATQLIKTGHLESVSLLVFLNDNILKQAVYGDMFTFLLITVLLFLIMLVNIMGDQVNTVRQAVYCYSVEVSLWYTIRPMQEIMGLTLCYVLLAIYCAPCLLIGIHKAYCLVKLKGIRALVNGKWIRKMVWVYVGIIGIFWKRRSGKVAIIVSPIAVAIFVNLVIKYPDIINIGMYIYIVIVAIGICFAIIGGSIELLHDWYWIKHQTITKSMTRERVDQNLTGLNFDMCRRAYIEMLLQEKVELTGQWPDGRRKKYHNDRLEFSLAKLDCATLESYNYLF